MKKYFLFTLLFAATSLFAEDAVLVEKFSNVVQTSSNGATGGEWAGDVCKWDTKFARRGTGDLINGKQATWLTMSTSNPDRGYVKTKDLEGGIKAVSFLYAQFGSEAGKVLKWKVTAGEISDTVERDGDKGANKDNPDTYNHTFACKKVAQLEIFNATEMDNGDKPTSNARIMFGDITITPYLLYTTKEATLDLRLGSNKYTNNNLINNTEDNPVVYSISENTIGATINSSTGEVTATNAGDVTVTATWEEITTSYKLTILTKGVATAAFEKENITIMIGDAVPTNDFTTNSTSTVSYVSSVPAAATVDPATGAVTVVAPGTTVITANVAENSDYTAVSASYTLRINPENYHMETFDGAHNVTLGGDATYTKTPTAGEPSTATGVTWTTLLGSVRDNLAQTGTENISAVIRSKKSAESDYAYLMSDAIHGGIDSIAFKWNCNGSEALRTKPWDIEIYINDQLIGKITDACTAIKPKGSEFVFSKGGLKINGDFTFKFVNKNEADDGTSNQYRWVIDDLEWYGYCTEDFGMLVDGTKYISGARDWSKTDHMEYKIVAELDKDQVVEFQNYCTKEKLATITQEENCYWFTNNSGVLSAPAKGTYTVYLKMYGIDNNSLWTEFVADSSTGIEGVQNTEYRVQKTIENGQLIIIREGKKYNAQGAEMR